jgi:hypothetical protein
MSSPDDEVVPVEEEEVVVVVKEDKLKGVTAGGGPTAAQLTVPVTSSSCIREIKINDLIYISLVHGGKTRFYAAEHGILYGMIVYMLHDEVFPENIPELKKPGGGNSIQTPLYGYQRVSDHLLVDISTRPKVFNLSQ